MGRNCCSRQPSNMIAGTWAETKGEVDLRKWEPEYADLKINWFPGHMVKANNVIRDKLKHVDMVFEVRDARIPFSSANADLDRLIGPNKARLIILNKSDLANPRSQQAVLKRFEAEGKAAIFACGKTGTHVGRVLSWAKEQGARRGEFVTTGAVAMVVGMPNVGKSSLINLLRGKATNSLGGGGENAKKVARVGPTPGVTRHVSAFCIATSPPLYLVDTPGVMVPRVTWSTVGLRLALCRAVPESAVRPDILVAFMLRLVRTRRPIRRFRRARLADRLDANMTHGRNAVALATTSRSATSAVSALENDSFYGSDHDDDDGQDADGPPAVESIEKWLKSGGMGPGSLETVSAMNGDAKANTFATQVTTGQRKPATSYVRERDWWEDEDMEQLLLQVERESGAQGKVEPQSKRRICCRYLLDAFWEGRFGKITLDNVLTDENDVNDDNAAFSLTASRGDRDGDETEPLGSRAANKLSTRRRKRQGNRDRLKSGTKRDNDPELTREREWLPANLDRDWSSASAWEVTEKDS